MIIACYYKICLNIYYFKVNNELENGSTATFITPTITSKNNSAEPVDELIEESNSIISEENETWISKCTWNK